MSAATFVPLFDGTLMHLPQEQPGAVGEVGPEAVVETLDDL